MDNLRLILIAVGLVILALIVVLHRPSGERKPHARRRGGEKRVEPGLGGADAGPDPMGEDAPGEAENPHQASLPDLETDEPRRGGSAPAIEAGASRSSGRGQSDPAVRAGIPDRREPALGSTPAADSDRPRLKCEKIVTVYVRARNERMISGLDLLDAAIKAGLSFGEMNIFHRRQEGASQPVFSMANLTRPGSFDPDDWPLLETPGVALFMTLPGPLSALDAWDATLATGRRLAELLEADLVDSEGQALTRERIGEIREELREYDRRAGVLG